MCKHLSVDKAIWNLNTLAGWGKPGSRPGFTWTNEHAKTTKCIVYTRILTIVKIIPFFLCHTSHWSQQPPNSLCKCTKWLEFPGRSGPSKGPQHPLGRRDPAKTLCLSTMVSSSIWHVLYPILMSYTLSLLTKGQILLKICRMLQEQQN